jgi:hypothetical protein
VGFHALARLTPHTVRRAIFEWSGGLATTRACHRGSLGEVACVTRAVLR